jgi:hypothetical protein
VVFSSAWFIQKLDEELQQASFDFGSVLGRPFWDGIEFGLSVWRL